MFFNEEYTDSKAITWNSVKYNVGKIYIIKPHNPKKMKNRDRIGVITHLANPYKSKRVCMKFSDTKREGIHDDITELVLYDFQ